VSNDLDAAMAPAEVAQLFSVTPQTVARWADSGRLPFFRTLGGHRRFRREDVMALAAQPAAEEAS
jgi:excisionase family DNA binding protein